MKQVKIANGTYTILLQQQDLLMSTCKGWNVSSARAPTIQSTTLFCKDLQSCYIYNIHFCIYALTKFTWFNPHKKGLFFESECERSRAWGCVGAMACRSHKPVRRGSDEGSAEETGEQVPEIGAFLSDSHCH